MKDGIYLLNNIILDVQIGNSWCFIWFNKSSKYYPIRKPLLKELLKECEYIGEL